MFDNIKIFKTKIVNVRKKHQCVKCGGKIKAKEKAENTTNSMSFLPTKKLLNFGKQEIQNKIIIEANGSRLEAVANFGNVNFRTLLNFLQKINVN